MTVLLPSLVTASSMLYSLLGKGAMFVISLELVLDIIYNVRMVSSSMFSEINGQRTADGMRCSSPDARPRMGRGGTT